MDHWRLLLNVAEPVFRDLVVAYIQRRNVYNRNIAAAIGEEMTRIGESIHDFRKFAEPKLMSSFPYYNVDIGIIVENLNKSRHRKLEKRIIQLGYQFTRIIDGYFCYLRKIAIDPDMPEIEVEIKIRDLGESATIIALHDYIDNKVGMEERNFYTYMKHLLDGTKEYHKLKISFFNSVLKRIYRNPEFEGNRNWFFTEV